MTPAAAPAAARAGHRSLLARGLQGASAALAWLCLALVFSIVTEWIGMTWLWVEEGAKHSERMLARELEHLSGDFESSVLTARPVEFARSVAEGLHDLLLVRTGVARAAGRITVPPTAGEPRLRRSLRPWVISGTAYLEAAMNTVRVFGARLAVLVLALPLFVLMGLVAFTDGLVQRDVRRWSGGRESAFLYHHAKRALLPSLIGAWVLYLAWPVSVHPNYVILPFGALFSGALALSASTFKKYL